jgi:DtxR family Mn-dependent transcriptional regulator
VNPAVGRYLTGLYWLSQTNGVPVRTGDLSSYLDVSPASVTQMLSELSRRSLVDYEKHRGATLTDAGESVATDFARRQCIVTRFFCSVLGTDLDRETAYEIGYRLPETGVRRLSQRIGEPCAAECDARAHPTEACLVA